MDFTQIETAIVLTAAGLAGLVCGLLPLGIGVWRRRIGLGLVGCAACLLAGLALGMLLALPVAVLCAAGIYRATQWDRQQDTLGHAIHDERLPILCTIMFCLGIAVSGASWIILVGLTPIYAEFAWLRGSKPLLFENASESLYLMGWIGLFIGVVGNLLMLLRYRVGMWLGWIFLASALVLPLTMYFQLDSTSLNTVELSASNTVVMLYCLLAFAVLYFWALLSFQSWSRIAYVSRKAERPGVPTNVPAWMSKTRFTPDRGKTLQKK